MAAAKAKIFILVISNYFRFRGPKILRFKKAFRQAWARKAFLYIWSIGAKLLLDPPFLY